MSDLLREKVASGRFFPEPDSNEPKFLANTPDIEKIRFGKNSYHRLAREKINRWLVDWDFDDLSDIVSRLESKKAAQHEGAVWELFLNSMFKSLGYRVGRDPLSGSGKTPDFLIRKNFTKFYVEATCISSTLKTTKEKNWIDLLSQIETIERDDFYIDISPTKLAEEVPKSSVFKREINNFLDQFDYRESAHWTNETSPTKRIAVGSWEIEVRISRRPARGNPELFVRMRTFGGTALITDLDDLVRKIDSKRKRYGKLKHPYIIAILENSFPSGNDMWHRYGALFGNEEVLISGDGSYKLNRKPGGVWEISKGETNVNALLLLDRLDSWQKHHVLPELWTNPNLRFMWFYRRLPFQYRRLKKDVYQMFREPLLWDGINRIGT